MHGFLTINVFERLSKIDRESREQLKRPEKRLKTTTFSSRRPESFYERLIEEVYDYVLRKMHRQWNAHFYPIKMELGRAI